RPNRPHQVTIIRSILHQRVSAMNDTCFAHLSHRSSSNGSELERSEAPLPHGAQKVARNNAAIGCHHHPQLNDGQLLLPRDGRDPDHHVVHRKIGGGGGDGDEAVVVAAERQGPWPSKGRLCRAPSPTARCPCRRRRCPCDLAAAAAA
uniref:Uncharacterized protein n=1 Tax=Oryza glaberrima TaxID=4538 RepID=I1R698_ORYGL